MACYEYGEWHKGHLRTVVVGVHGMGIVCDTCGVYADLEAISKKISASDACKVGKPSEVERSSLGKMSPGVEVK